MTDATTVERAPGELPLTNARRVLADGAEPTKDLLAAALSDLIVYAERGNETGAELIGLLRDRSAQLAAAEAERDALLGIIQAIRRVPEHPGVVPVDEPARRGAFLKGYEVAHDVVRAIIETYDSGPPAGDESAAAARAERAELFEIFTRWIVGNEGRETADSSFSLDHGLEMLDTWLDRRDERVRLEQLARIARLEQDLATLRQSPGIADYAQLIDQRDRARATLAKIKKFVADAEEAGVILDDEERSRERLGEASDAERAAGSVDRSWRTGLRTILGADATAVTS